jgi:hypothetical protein
MSAEIGIEMGDRPDGWIATVTVSEGVSATTHRVTIKRDAYEAMTGGKIKPEELVKLSFEFLLEREPKESIMRQFDLLVVGMYFPEYDKEMKKRLRKK